MHEQHDPGLTEVEAFQGRRQISPTLIGFAVVAAATLVFILQNTEKPRIKFLFLSVRTRLWLALIIAVLLGILLDRLLQSWWRRRNRE